MFLKTRIVQKNIMSKLFFVGILIFLGVMGPLYGQSNTTSLSAPFPSDRLYEILPMEKGVFGISVDKLRKELNYFFTDEDFIIKTSGKSTFADISVFILHKVKEDKAYILFNSLSAPNFQKTVMIIDSNTGEVTYIPVNNYILPFIDEFYILENSIALVGLYNHFNMVHFVDIINSNQKPFTINLDMKIFDIAESDGFLDILATTQMVKGGNKLQLITLDEQGKRLYTIEAETCLSKNDIIKSAYLQKNQDGRFRAVGTYSTSKRQHFSGYFYWDMDYSLDQNFVLHPAALLSGFVKGNHKKHNRRIKYEMTRGFGIVKILEENGQLAIVSAPNKEYSYQKRYPRLYKNELFHVLYIDKNGKKKWDETFAFHRSLRSPYVDPVFLTNPPMYMVNGNVYFLYNEEFTRTPSLIVHNIRSDAKYLADELSFTIPQTAQLYKTTHFKNNEIIVYGLKENRQSKNNFFLGKLPLY